MRRDNRRQWLFKNRVFAFVFVHAFILVWNLLLEVYETHKASEGVAEAVAVGDAAPCFRFTIQ
ncbi:hypothetical protein MKX08_010526 [Trichoderma sp. CBMAI-0020]|nr:hypothetical protein MKX08_010526 [Trichoderma sp. CBMAI-0020]